MQNIPLEMAAPEMVLARDIMRENGMVLCGKGTKLSEALIERLRNMQISSVTVEGHPVIEKDEKTVEQELCDLDNRFKFRTDDQVLMKIKNIIGDLIRRSWE